MEDSETEPAGARKHSATRRQRQSSGVLFDDSHHPATTDTATTTGTAAAAVHGQRRRSTTINATPTAVVRGTTAGDVGERISLKVGGVPLNITEKTNPSGLARFTAY